jgi:hypothetical protein
MRFHLVRSWAYIAGAFVLGACSSNDLPEDLPAGWENAARVKSLAQEVCPNTGMELSNEHASFTAGAGSIGVEYQDAHFRCEQDVEGFFKGTGDTVDILVQPKDMSPTSVVKCSCGYNITFIVEPVSAGTMQTTLYRRWDGLNNPNDPVQISTELVTVR